MAKNDNLKDFLTDVADAIREKKGTTDLINPQDFSAEIASIKSGGGAVAVSPKAVNFRDYDGTILHSYTKDEFLALSELPPLPTREGLICQEWNWDFADAVEYVSKYGVLEVGATYITDDGKTRLYITIAAEGRMDVPLYFRQSVANGVTIDWGDGATETLSGVDYVNTTHHYDAIGDYVISLEVADGCSLGLYGASTYSIMGITGNNNGRVYCNMLRKIEIGRGVSSIETYVFNRCTSLASVVIPKEVTGIRSYAFNMCYGLTFVVLPKSMMTIKDYAFQTCSTLASIAIPKTLTSISPGTFQGCASLAIIVIPKSIKSIEKNAFYNCFSVAYYDFTDLDSIPSLADASAFTAIASDCKIIVPDALYDTWRNATNWSTYASYIIKKSEWDALNA